MNNKQIFDDMMNAMGFRRVESEDDDIGQICYECATAKSWAPKCFAGTDKPIPVGMWPGKCDVCGEEKILCAPRDYVKKIDNEQV